MPLRRKKEATLPTNSNYSELFDFKIQTSPLKHLSVLLTLYYCVSINSGYSTLATCIKESSNRDQGRCGAPIW